MDEVRERYSRRLSPIRDTLWRQFRRVVERVANRRDGEIELVFAGKHRLLVINTEHERFFYSFPLPTLARALFAGIKWVADPVASDLRATPGMAAEYELLERMLWTGFQPPQIDSADPDAGYVTASRELAHAVANRGRQCCAQATARPRRDGADSLPLIRRAIQPAAVIAERRRRRSVAERQYDRAITGDGAVSDPGGAEA